MWLGPLSQILTSREVAIKGLLLRLPLVLQQHFRDSPMDFFIMTECRATGGTERYFSRWPLPPRGFFRCVLRSSFTNRVTRLRHYVQKASLHVDCRTGSLQVASTDVAANKDDVLHLQLVVAPLHAHSGSC